VATTMLRLALRPRLTPGAPSSLGAS
jgi:hypothetical protein